MGRKKNKGADPSTDRFRISEVVAISIKVQLDNFIKDDIETELKFPSSLSKEERAFVHEKAKLLGLQSKSTGSGTRRYITVFKRAGSAIIQKDANFVLTSSMRESINALLVNQPITENEKENLMTGCENDAGYSLPRESSYLSGSPNIPNTFTNPDVLNFKRDLPVYSYKEQILSAVKSNQVLIILGETGSGKTTQIPHYILDQHQQEKKACRIICTQPRRISAISVAERVAYECNEKVGHSIGYQIRLESKLSPKTVLTYCTCGVLLRTLMGGNGALSNITHIIVDEVHERDKLTDFLLISLKEIISKYKDLRVILMSATIDHSLFSRYFNNCPVINIPGRLFDVEQYYLENILEMTGYYTREMEKVRRKLGFDKPKKNGSKVEEKPKQLEEEVKQISLDGDLQADFDEFLNDCFVDGSPDSFGQIMYMYMSENIPVNLKHSSTGLTGLMAAAYHCSNETVEQLVQMGADPSVTDTHHKTAIDYAKMKGNDDCAQYLEYIAKGLHHSPGVASHFAQKKQEEHNELLETYLQTVSEDTIDYNLIVHLVQNIHLNHPKGSILVFVSGYEDIISIKTLIENSDEMNASKYQIFTLHSNMQTIDQKRVFSRIPDTRKIIIATNIAETSITIDDVVYVIDSGKAKELYYEPASGACSLQLIWISKACARQRAGRAGRLQPGKCFILSSQRRFQSFLDNSIPEILRAPLHELCLQTKRLAPTNTPIADFLSKAIEPPVFSAVRNSVSLLKTIGALSPMENLTELGELLLELPIDPQLGKMLIYACIFKCLDPILTITSSLSFNEPFQIGSDPESRRKATKARRSFSGESMSDHMALLRAFQEWTEAKIQKKQKVFCEKSLINGATMESISGLKSKFIAELRSIGLIKSRGMTDIRELNVNSEKWYVVKAILFCGLYPSVARVDRQEMVLRASKEVKLCLHPQSTLVQGGGKENQIKALKTLPTDWVMFGDMNRMGRLCYIRNNTIITTLTVALFGGPLRILPSALRSSVVEESEDSEGEDDEVIEENDDDVSYLSIDDWIFFKSKLTDNLAVLLLRQKFAIMMIRKMLNPAKSLTQADNNIVNTIIDLLAKEEYKANLAIQTGIWQSHDSPSHQRADTSRHNDNESTKSYSNSSYRPGNSPYYVFFGAKPRSNNYGGKEKKSYNGTRNSYSSRSSGSDVYAESGECKYFLVKAPSQKVVEESQSIGKWNFIPGTEGNIVNSAKLGYKTILFFSIGNTVQKFIGWAEFVLVTPEGNPPTIYPVRWISKNHLSHNAVRHLSNSLDENRRVGGTRDGLEIASDCGTALMELIAAASPIK